MAQNTKKQARSLEELRKMIATGRKKRATVPEVIYIYLYLYIVYIYILLQSEESDDNDEDFEVVNKNAFK